MELYIHIPFCVKKCDYCDFLSFAADEQTQKSYVAALQKELAFTEQSIKIAGSRRFLSAAVPFLAEGRLYAGNHGDGISLFFGGTGCRDHDRVQSGYNHGA